MGQNILCLLRTLCASSRKEVLDGFVSEKLSQVMGNLKFNLFGTELPFFKGKRVCAILFCSAHVWDSGSVHCAPVAEARHLLDL